MKEKMKMNSNIGRPKKYTTDEIKKIIDEYVIFTQGIVLINASRVAEYAKTRKGINDFRYYVINRNEECKKYIENLNKKIKEETISKNNIPITSFQSIDVNTYLNMSKERLKTALVNLNSLMEKMADNNFELAKQKEEAIKLIDKKNLEIVSLKKEIENYREKESIDFESKDEEYKELNRRIKVLTKEKEQRDIALRLLWNEQAECILKEEGIFESDNQELDNNKIITNTDENMKNVFKDVKTLNNSFMEKLKGL